MARFRRIGELTGGSGVHELSSREESSHSGRSIARTSAWDVGSACSHDQVRLAATCGKGSCEAKEWRLSALIQTARLLQKPTSLFQHFCELLLKFLIHVFLESFQDPRGAPEN